MTRIVPTLGEFLRSWGDPDAMRWLVSTKLSHAPGQIAKHSRETSTHYKWLLANDQRTSTRVWLHEFKPANERRSGYAESIHNHRYAFQSWSLNGGYVNNLYRVQFDQSGTIHECELIESQLFRVDCFYEMQPDEFHSIDQLESDTQTLVIEGTALQLESYSVDVGENCMIRHIPIEVRAKNLARLGETLRPD